MHGARLTAETLQWGFSEVFLLRPSRASPEQVWPAGRAVTWISSGPGNTEGSHCLVHNPPSLQRVSVCSVVCKGLHLKAKIKWACFPLEMGAVEFISPSGFFLSPLFFPLNPFFYCFSFHSAASSLSLSLSQTNLDVLQEGSAISAALSLLLVRIYLAIIFSFFFPGCSVALKSRCQEWKEKIKRTCCHLPLPVQLCKAST